MDARAVRDRLNEISRRTLAPVPLTLWQGAFPKDLIALCYHMVSDEDVPHFRFLKYKSSAQFEADVRFARDRAVTYREVANHRLNGTPLPKNRVLFTFDDGFVECYDVIRPILRRHGVDGVFFLTTDYIDDRDAFFECTLSLLLTQVERMPLDALDAVLRCARVDREFVRRDAGRYGRALARLKTVRVRVESGSLRELAAIWLLGFEREDRETIEAQCPSFGVDLPGYAAGKQIFMTRAQVRALVADGFTVGAHGLQHRLLACDDPQALEREIVACCEVVREMTGQERVPFAFPYSGLHIARGVIAGILERNPVVELVFDSGCLRSDPRFIVNRVFNDVPGHGSESNTDRVLREAWSVPSAWFRPPAITFGEAAAPVVAGSTKA
jgi:peptidoglycan/xylan/chitin deacetylase (PgdA/CDA1 family)